MVIDPRIPTMAMKATNYDQMTAGQDQTINGHNHDHDQTLTA